MRRTRADSDTISLFPFLAVLVCTMGSLIVLLFVVARQARLQAASAMAPAPAHADSERHAKLAALRSLRDRMDQRLERDRRILRHLEARIRTLRGKLQSLKEAARDVSQAGASSDEQLARDRQELRRLNTLIAEAEEDLEQLRKHVRSRKPSYAIVPFQGSHRTFRQPIYVECQADRVVLQPEGVALVRADFEGPLDPGNPLAAAVRAAADYYAQRQQSIADASPPARNTEAYPLLIVRPDGIVAYYRVREALASWEGQFGYELVAADWDLKYATADPQLARREQQAIEEARLRRVRLARAAPSQFGGLPTPSRADGRGLRFQPFDDDSPAGERPMTARRKDPAGPAATVPKDATTSNPPRPGVESPTGSSADEPPPDAQTIPGGPVPASGPSHSLAAQRGPNWALPGRGRHGVPLQRPVRIVVRKDRLVILDDDAPRESLPGGQVVSATAGTPHTVDALVDALQQHVRSWGIAGKQMHWKPVLKLHVTPDGERLARQLEQALAGSGLETVRATGHGESSRNSER